MEYYVRKATIAFISVVFTCVFLIGCFSPWQGEMAAFSINLGSQNSRAIEYPPGSADTASLRFTASFTPVHGGASVTFSSVGKDKISGSIAPGTYFVSVDIAIRENGSVFARGEAIDNPVTLVPGASAAIAVNVSQLSYTVSFDLNGGSGPLPESFNVFASNEIEIPLVTGISHGSYDFGGWCTNPDGDGYAYSFNEKFIPLNDTVLYAKWTYGFISGIISINPSASLNGDVYCCGEAITVTAMLDGGDVPQFQWKRNNENIYGATGSIYTPGEADWNQEINVAVTSPTAAGVIVTTAVLIYKPVSNSSELQAIGASASSLAGNYLVVSKIEPTGYGTWNPIGSASMPFTGVFDGNGNTINMGNSVLYNNRLQNYTGLFGRIDSDGIVKNVRLEGTFSLSNSIPVDGELFVGAVAGRNEGIITNISSSASVTISISAANSGFAGGIAGSNTGNIRNCYNTGNVSASDNVNDPYAGGIAGKNEGYVGYCWMGGNVTASSESNTPYTGGIVCDNMTTVENCVALGSQVGSGLIDSSGRITVWDSGSRPTVILTGNYAREDMLNGSDTVTAGTSDNLKNGGNVALTSINEFWWINNTLGGPNWDIVFAGIVLDRETKPWEWNDGVNRPRLWFE